MDMTIKEAMDYVKALDDEGITLTESGLGAAEIILERRKGWSDAHAAMLTNVRRIACYLLKGKLAKLPYDLIRLVERTRLGDAIELARNLTREDRRREK